MTVLACRGDGQVVRTQSRSILALVLLGAMLSNLEVGLVNVALPTLAAVFGVGPGTIQGVALSYQLAIVGTLVLFGRLVDLLGGRVLYLAGMGTVAVASILAVLSQGLPWLVLARALLGLGAAMLLSTGQALLTVAYPNGGRGQALGLMHAAVAAGLMAGPSLGGLLVTTASWRTIFLAPLPLTAGALWWGWKILPRTGGGTHGRLDLVGAALIFAATTLLLLALTRLSRYGWGEMTSLLLGLALVAGLLFVLAERRQPAPLVDLRLLGSRRLSAGLLAAWLTFIALASNMFLVPFALQDLMGYPVAVAGLVMMAVPLAILPMAPLAGSLADRLGSRRPATAGLVLIVAAILAMTAFRSTTPLWFAVAILTLYGVGAGLFQAPNNSTVLGSAPQGQEGTVAGMLALSRNLGQVVGVAVASTAWTWRQAHYERVGQPAGDALAASLRDAFLVLAAFGVLALAVSALRGERSKA